ncbi:hypothetical protein JAO29_23340, partial [Edaphobacter sp. HDX4]
VRVGMIYRERNAPAKPVAAPAREKIADDDLVFLKKKRQSSMATPGISMAPISGSPQAARWSFIPPPAST